MEAYKKSSGASNGALAMIDLLVQDLVKEMTLAEAEEKAAQEDYERTMSDSADKRAADSKSLNDKEGNKADLESELVEGKSSHAATSKEHLGNEQYIASLHAECDFLVQYFSVRKQARADEIDSLSKATAVLSGADYSLLQKTSA